MLTVDDIKTGSVVHVRLPQLARLDNSSLSTLYRAVKGGALVALIDSFTGKLVVKNNEALRWLSRHQAYKFDPTSLENCKRMEHARGFKGRLKNGK